MYHKIRITVASLAAIMLCIAGSSMTLSYFTDTDAEENDFVIGNVSTELTIYRNETGTKLDVGAYTTANPVVNGSDVPFYLSAQNNGNVAVYQRFRIVMPKALASYVTLVLEDCTLSNGSCSNDNYVVTYDDDVENHQYAEYYIVSKNVLSKNTKTAEWPATALHFGNIEDVDMSQYDHCGTDNNSCVLGIKAYSDAIQTTGFTSATEAFADFGETY